MISTPNSVKAVERIDEAVNRGARRFKACEELGISDRTYRRWISDGDGIRKDARPDTQHKAPANKLSAQERQAILDVCPPDGFESLDDAREWMSMFVSWYNDEHRHSSIKHVTPSQRHSQIDGEILEKRDELYQDAKRKQPLRWSGKTRDWKRVGEVWLNPENSAKNCTHRENKAA